MLYLHVFSWNKGKVPPNHQHKSSMKKTHIFIFTTLAAMLTACNGGQKTAAPERVVETEDSVTGIISLRELHRTDSLSVAGQTYTYQYDFVPTDSLPVVRNPQGDDYHDNKVTLVVRQGARTIVQRTFTKHDFSELVPQEFMQTSALVGFTYNYTKLDDHSALYFIATVGDPDETADMAFPIQLKVTPQGSVSMEKATGLDTEPINPGMTIDPSDEGGV